MSAFAAALRGAHAGHAGTGHPGELRKLTGAAGAALVLRDLASSELVVDLAVNWRQPTGARTGPGTGLAGAVIASGQPEWRDAPPAVIAAQAAIHQPIQ